MSSPNKFPRHPGTNDADHDPQQDIMANGPKTPLNRPDDEAVKNTGAPLASVWRLKLWPESIRSDLIVSQLLLLTLIVLGFGGAILWLVWQGTYRQVEADLLGAAELLAQDLRSQSEVSSLMIARTYRHRFGPAPRDHAYFAVWDQSGLQIGGSDPLPPHTRPLSQLPPADGRRPFVSRTHGSHLEVIVRGPHGEQVLVGRPMAKENDGLRRLLVAVGLSGLLSLAAGATGAWWLARRIITPLELMTHTAEQISFRHLNQRLATASASNEVTRLATVFNTMLDRLQASFQQQVRFTADASHELRTPVAVILTQAEHSLSRPRESAEYCAALQTCVTAAVRMKRLIDDLLILARADMGRLELRRVPLDLAEVVRGALALLAPLAEERKIRLSSQLLSAGVDGDALRLSQVVTNLVTNGIRYNRPEGNVSVSVFQRDSRSWLVVADSGIGIPLSDQQHIRERFYRADPARTFDDHQGTGLGLSIADEIITAHGGTMEITSQPDHGTTVTVQLPSVGVATFELPVSANATSSR
jgi:two-component system, OmpR family, sensor kinase